MSPQNLHFTKIETADLVTFTEEILNGRLHFFVQFCETSSEQNHRPHRNILKDSVKHI